MTGTALPATFPVTLSSGTGASSEVPSRYPAALNGRGVFLELSLYDRQTLDLLRAAIDQSGEAGEQSRSTEGYWIRSGQDWSFGAGQKFYDRTGSGSASDRRRFRTSKGIAWTTEGELGLLRDTELADAGTGTNLRLLTVGDYLYKVDGVSLEFWDGATWTGVTLTGVGASILDITTDGGRIFVCDGAAVWRVAAGVGGSHAAWSSVDTDVIAYANGRLIGADANEIFELDSTGAKVVIDTHDNTTFAWVDAIPTVEGVLVAGGAGNLSEISLITVDASDGSLKVPVIAAPTFVGETVNVLATAGPFILIGTSLGFRVASLSSGNLTIGALVEIDGGVHDFTFERRYAWFTLTNLDATSTGVGLIDLGVFTDPELLVPAWAPDVLAVDQGASLSVARYDGDTWFAISEVGFWRETDELVAEGTLYGGRVTHSDTEDKIAHGATLRHEPLEGSVTFQLGLSDGTTVTCGTSSAAGTVKPSETFTARSATSDWFEPILLLSRDAGDTTAGPRLTLWRLLSLPTGARVDVILAPIKMAALVEGEAYNPLEFFEWLQSLAKDRTPVPWQEGSLTTTVIVDKIRIAQPDAWDSVDLDVYFRGIFLVRLLTLEL